MAGAGEAGYPSGLDEHAAQLPTQLRGKLSAIGSMGPSPGAPAGLPRPPELRALERSLACVVAQMGDGGRTPRAERARVAEAAFVAMDATIRALDESLRAHEGELRREGMWPAASAARPPTGARAGGGERSAAASSRRVAGRGEAAKGREKGKEFLAAGRERGE